ncbi:hypothetical protein P775_01545 [Puniceibacterium antarcticum]|uniref:Serine aminopeptidase S33 domain-containing protein n=1 Tax=Puniceibacterium antarcticum TaxID=1206336 RepID=A0A2G8RKB7_9RHOB|nr:alpha/beta fold hydrolase [Puniceibacterium antarcticum]PIL22009.1 hypothetical protein P775_01545 [Puniceibacterium antarcticum]
MDKRGHGLSDDSLITMDLLVADVTALMDHLSLPPALICGISVGDMISQGVLAQRPDLAAGVVLGCTWARIADDAGWNARIDAVLRDGITPVADAILGRWFSPDFMIREKAAPAMYGNMLIRTSPVGYAGLCGAIRDTDFTDLCRAIGLPTHCVVGADDSATPPRTFAATRRFDSRCPLSTDRTGRTSAL